MPELTNYLQILKQVSTVPDEQEILTDLKYAGPQLRQMNLGQVHNWAKVLLLKVHIITGWVVPEDEFLQLLIEQFEKKLIEDYFMLNAEEITYAFRKHGTLVKDWGKAMNLNLIDQVLTPYVSSRLQASAIEEQKYALVPAQKIYTDEEITNERRRDIEHAFQALKKGYYPILHSYFKQVLEEDKLLNEGESLADFFVRKLTTGIEHLYIKAS